MNEQQEAASLYTGFEEPKPLVKPQVGQTFSGPGGTQHRILEVLDEEDGTVWVKYVNLHNKSETQISLEGFCNKSYDLKDPV